MRKRPWLVWLIIVIIFVLAGTALWMKMIVEEQPEVHPDPGIPDVEVPLPEEVE